MLINYDCRYFRGDLPCKYRRMCEGCESYSPVIKRILVHKSGNQQEIESMLNDIEIMKRTQGNLLVHWLCDESTALYLENNDFIDRIIIKNLHAQLMLAVVIYDEVIDYDDSLVNFMAEFSKLNLVEKMKEKPQKRILILKFGAIGDVLRTTTLLPALKKKFPECLIDWVCPKKCSSVIENNAFIDKIYDFDSLSCKEILSLSYRALINLDKDTGAIALAMLVNSQERYGFGMTKFGTVTTLNKKSEYSFQTGLDDELKFKLNRKTYQKIICDMVELDYEKHSYILDLTKEQNQVSKKWINKTGDVRNIRIGINTGCGPVFPLKKWTVDGYVGLIESLLKLEDVSVLLLGGVCERERNRVIANRVGEGIVDTGGDNSLHDFISIVQTCHILVTGDTAAMHFGIGLQKRVIALMGPTSWTEIDLYGKGKIIRSSVNCEQCTHKKCVQSPTCMESITVEQVYQAVIEEINSITKLDTFKKGKK